MADQTGVVRPDHHFAPGREHTQAARHGGTFDDCTDGDCVAWREGGGFLLLEDAAYQARERRVAAEKELLAEHRATYRAEAAEVAAKVAYSALGEFARRATWTPREPTNGIGYEATCEIDGLRFLAIARGRYSDGDLYLLSVCPNGDHEPSDRLHRVRDLAHLADLLDTVEQATEDGTGVLYPNCQACETLREDRVETVVQQVDAAKDQLERALAAFVDKRVDDKLDGFLSTYLPDRI